MSKSRNFHAAYYFRGIQTVPGECAVLDVYSFPSAKLRDEFVEKCQNQESSSGNIFTDYLTSKELAKYKRFIQARFEFAERVRFHDEDTGDWFKWFFKRQDSGFDYPWTRETYA